MLETIDTFTSLMLFSWKKRVVYEALNTSLSGYSYHMNSHLLQANHHIQRPPSIPYPWFHWGIPPSLSESVCLWTSTLSVVYRLLRWRGFPGHRGGRPPRWVRYSAVHSFCVGCWSPALLHNVCPTGDLLWSRHP